MNIYVFPRVSELTTRWHSSGGLVVVAESREDVEAMLERGRERTKNSWDEDGYPLAINDSEWEQVVVYELKGDAEKVAYIFPDAGCC